MVTYLQTVFQYFKYLILLVYFVWLSHTQHIPLAFLSPSYGKAWRLAFERGFATVPCVCVCMHEGRRNKLVKKGAHEVYIRGELDNCERLNSGYACAPHGPGKRWNSTFHDPACTRVPG